MSGRFTNIIASDYNTLQARTAQVLGTGSGDYGYGQTLLSSQITSNSTISGKQWNNLRNDILRARQHQTGNDERANIVQPVLQTRITEADRLTYSDMLDLVIANRLITPPLPSTQFSRDALMTATRTTAWNGTTLHSVVVNFASADAARFFFNTSSSIEFSASKYGGSVGGSSKNNAWTTMFAHMGTISFGHSTTTNTGISGTPAAIGYVNLTTSDQTIFLKNAETLAYSPNEYRIKARLGVSPAQVIFTVTFGDLVGPNPTVDEDVDGVLVSTVQLYRASGSNVSVPAPSTTGSISGGTVTVATPALPPAPPAPTYIVRPNVTVIGEGSTAVTFTVNTSSVADGTQLYWTTATSTGTLSISDFTDNKVAGTITVSSDLASFTRTATADLLTEGTETFYINIRTGSISGPIVATSVHIDILDSSITP